MKKRKLKARLNGHIDYFRNLALKRLDANTTLRRDLADLRHGLEDLKAGCAHATADNVALSAAAEEWKKERADRIANFAALEQAHEALHAQNMELVAQRDAALARARKSDEMFSRIQAMCWSEDV